MSFRTALPLLALVATVTPLAAQEPSRVYTVRPRVGSGVMVGPQSGSITVTSSRRAVIGVYVDLRPSPSDSLGATLQSVTPGSPAARAGIVAGDIITRFDGTALVERGARSRGGDDTEEDQSAPGLRLLELTSRMSPGDTVAVEWRHDRARKTAQIVAERAAAQVYSMNGDDELPFRVFSDEGPGMFKYNWRTGPGDLGGLEHRLDELRGMTMAGDGRGQMFFRSFGPFGGVQFAPLNDDLGRYFGTTDGILVLDTPDSSAHIDLKGGDVIMSVGGRKPTNVEHLMRILGSYEDSETVTFEVMRDHRRMSLDAKAGDIRSGGRADVILRNMLPDRPSDDDRPTLPRRVPPRTGRPGA